MKAYIIPQLSLFKCRHQMSPIILCLDFPRKQQLQGSGGSESTCWMPSCFPVCRTVTPRCAVNCLSIFPPLTAVMRSDRTHAHMIRQGPVTPSLHPQSIVTSVADAVIFMFACLSSVFVLCFLFSSSRIL